MSQRTQVFISYSHDDQAYLDRLMPFLKSYEYHTPLELWSDQRLKAGDDWDSEIAHALERSTVALLLVSSSFLSSRFVITREVPKLLDKNRLQGLTVLPLLVRPSGFLDSPLARFQAFNDPKLPVMKLSELEAEELFVKVGARIGELARTPLEAPDAGVKVGFGERRGILTDSLHLTRTNPTTALETWLQKHRPEAEQAVQALRDEHLRIQTLPAQNLDQPTSFSFPGSQNVPISILNSSWRSDQIDVHDQRKIVFLEATYGFKLTPEEVQVKDYFVSVFSVLSPGATHYERGRDVAKRTLIKRLARLGDSLAKEAPKVNYRASFAQIQIWLENNRTSALRDVLVEISCPNPGREVFEDLPDWHYNAQMQQDIKPDYPTFGEKIRQFNVMVPGQRESLLEVFVFSDSTRSDLDKHHTFELRIYASELPTPIVQHLSLSLVGKSDEVE